MERQHTVLVREAPLRTPTDLSSESARDIAGGVNALLADTFTLYMKTKSFHWHMHGPHFRDYHLLLDEQASQIFAMTDVLAERVRKLGLPTLRSLGHAHRMQRISDNDADYITTDDMLAELREDNRQLVLEMRGVHSLCGTHGDVATSSVLETYIDEGERRIWFLFEAGRNPRG